MTEITLVWTRWTMVAYDTRARSQRTKTKQEKFWFIHHTSFFSIFFVHLSLLFILSGTQHIFLQFNGDDDGGGGDYFSVLFLSLVWCALDSNAIVKYQWNFHLM